MRFEHAGVSFDYDPDTCDGFIAACATIRDVLDAMYREHGAAYRDEYVRQLVEVLAPRSGLAEAPREVEQPGAVLRAQ